MNYDRGLAGFGDIIFQMTLKVFEALDIYEGLKMAQRKDFYPLIIESDSQNAIGLIIGKLESWRKIGWLVCEIRDLTKAVFDVVFYVYPYSL